MKATRLLTALVLLLFVFWSAPTIAEEKPATETKPPVEAKPAEVKPAAEKEFYYYVFIQGARVGWAQATLSHVNLDGKETIVEGLHLYTKSKRAHDGKEFESTMETKDYSLATGQPLRSWQTEKSGAQAKRTEIEYGEKEITLTQTIDGKSQVTKIPREYEDFYSTPYVFEKLKKDGMKPGAKFTFHGIDPASRKAKATTLTVVGPEEFTTVEGIKYSGTAIDSVSGEDTSKFVFDADGCYLKLVFGGGYIIVERTPKMPDDFKPDVFEGMANIMPSDVVIAADQQFSLKFMELHFKFKHDDSDNVPYLLDTNAYHDVIKYEAGGETGYAVKLKSQKLPADFKAPSLPLKDVPADVKVFLEPTPMCASDDAVWIAEAKKQTKDAKDSLDAAQKLCKFVAGYLSNETGTTAGATATQAYKEKKGDCTEHAALFVALARAAGLPARVCGGVVYLTMSDGKGGIKGIFGMHAWSEVWLGRWVPVDASIDAVVEVGTSPRYLLLNYSEPGMDYGSSRPIRMMQQEVHPKIDCFEVADGRTWLRKDHKRFDFSKPLTPKGK